MSRKSFAMVLTLAGIGGCNRTPPAHPAASPPPAIATVKPEKKAIRRTIEQPGSVQAFEETVLFPKLPGFVKTLGLDPAKATRPDHDRHVDLGSRVRANQVLAELAMPELEQEYQQKEALVRQREAEIVQARKARAAAEAAVTAARAHVGEAAAGLDKAQATFHRWQQEVERTSRLVTGGVIDAQTRDEIAHQFKVAEAGRSEAQARIVSAEAAVTRTLADLEKAAADIASAEAKRDVANADARRVGALREYQRIKAPFDGIVTRRTVSTGDHVTADGKSGLFAITRMDPVRVVLRVPEADAGLVMDGQTVRVALPAGMNAEGKVMRTSWSLEPGSRTLRTEVDLPNPDAKLRPGMFATARLTVESPAEWTLPAAAIARVADEPIAYLAIQGKAVRVIAQLGRGDGVQTQLRAYRKVSQTEWTPVSGQEVFAVPAAQLTDGQSLN